MRALDPEGVDAMTLGLGPWISKRSHNNLAVAMSLASEDTSGSLAEAIGRFGVAWLSRSGTLERDVERGLELGAPPSYFRGVGYRAWRSLVVRPYGGATYALKPQRVRAWLAQRPAAVVADLLAGFDEAREMHRLD